MSGSDLRLCHNYNLDWEQGPIKILGVIFTPEVFNIWDFNSLETVRKMEKILQSWSKRKLTLSKFIHLFTALLNPPEQFVKQLEKLFYKFLWNSEPDRISRNVIIQDVKEGGLRMIKINKFIESLKVTWLRRILISTNECSWNRLSHVDFRKLVIFGDGYAKLCASNLSNPFWIDVLNSWKAFLKCNPASQTEDVLNSPIWFNSEMQHGGKFFIKNWYEKGIKNIVDLVNENGVFYDFNQFKTLFNVRGTILDFQGVINRIPQVWKNLLNNNIQTCIDMKYNVICSKHVKLILKDKKGCKKIMKVLLKAKMIYQIDGNEI